MTEHNPFMETSKPLKEKQLREAARCAHCQKLIGEIGHPLFYLVTVERHFVDLQAINRKAGLEAMLGSPYLASVMGPDEDMTAPMMHKETVTICERCSTANIMVAQLAEYAIDKALKKQKANEEPTQET